MTTQKIYPAERGRALLAWTRKLVVPWGLEAHCLVRMTCSTADDIIRGEISQDFGPTEKSGEKKKQVMG